MKHTMKIMLPFLMIAGLLTGCGSQASQESTDTTAETTQATEAVTTAAVTEKETQAETEKAAEMSEPTEETKSENSDNKSLVVYFTPAENSGTDAISSATVTNWNGEDMGAAQVLAN